MRSLWPRYELPQLRSPVTMLVRFRPESGQARYFQEHAQFAEPVALMQAISRDAEAPVTRHVQQLHSLAQIVRRKYQHLRRAMQTMSLAMLVLSVVALVGAVQ